MNDRHYIQAIEIGHRVTHTVFDLPCIYSVHKEPIQREQGDARISHAEREVARPQVKDRYGLCYLLYDWDRQGQYVCARPGNWLCEDDDHRWHVLTATEYRQWQQTQKHTERQ